MDKYASVFKKIRLKNLLNDSASFELMKQDSIVPMCWIEPFFAENWLNIIYVDQNKYSHEFEIEKQVFDSECLRFGRVLSTETNITWRWVSFVLFRNESFWKRFIIIRVSILFLILYRNALITTPRLIRFDTIEFTLWGCIVSVPRCRGFGVPV